MTEYYVLYMLFGIIGYCTYRSQTVFEKKRKRAIWFCFILIFILLAFRHQSMGIDLGYYVNGHVSYLQAFDNLTDLPWSIALTGKYAYFETGYQVFCKLVGTIWKNRQFFLAVCAMVSLVPVAWVLSKKSDSPVLSCIIYLAFPSYEILFSGLRQGIAIGITVLALYFVQEKKPIRFLIAILIACFFHSSSCVFLVAYPAYNIKISKPVRFISVVLIFVVYLFRYPLFYTLAKLLKQNAVPDNNGAINFLIFLMLLYLVCNIFYKENDRNQNGLMNLLFICSFCQVFGNIYSTAIRVGYYFVFAITLLLPSVVGNMEPRLKIIAKLVIIVFFVAYGLWCIYNSSWSMRYPYYWCWESLM